jgi:ATP-dependent Clp protease, protease subunit
MSNIQYVLTPVQVSEDNSQAEEEGDDELPPEAREFFNNLGKDTDDLDRRGIILISGMISNDALARASKRLLMLHFDPDFKDDIQIIINSPGGHLDAMWSFIDLMRFVDNRVRTIALGEICSAAAFIFVAGDERIIAPNTSVMFHHFSGGFGGTYPALIASRKGQDIEYQKILRLLTECSKYNSEQEVLKNVLTEQDNWLTPKEMIAHGLADLIYKPQKKPLNKKVKRKKKA